MAEPQLHRYRNRQHAGEVLAREAVDLRLQDPIVLALPRGGVPVGAELARRLRAPLDVLFVLKIGVPYQPELAVAAVADGIEPEVVIDEEVFELSGMSRTDIDRRAEEEFKEIVRRRQIYMSGRLPLPVYGRCIILVDDGAATGTTMRAAFKVVQRREPARVVIAVAVAPVLTVETLKAEAGDLVICPLTPAHFRAVGEHYEDFHQVSDQEVLQALAWS